MQRVLESICQPHGNCLKIESHNQPTCVPKNRLSHYPKTDHRTITQCIYAADTVIQKLIPKKLISYLRTRSKISHRTHASMMVCNKDVDIHETLVLVSREGGLLALSYCFSGCDCYKHKRLQVVKKSFACEFSLIVLS